MADSGFSSAEIAFLYADGKLYLGRNHPEIMQQADLADQWGSVNHLAEPHNLVTGWIWNNRDGTQTAEFYSDFYQHAQDETELEYVYQLLKKEFPKLTELTFGPDKDTWKEMNEEPDWMEQYLPEKAAASSDDPVQIIRAITNFASHGVEPSEGELQHMTDEAHKLRYLPPDRLRMELDEILASKNPAGAMKLADECGLLDYMIPELGAAYDFNQNNPHHNLSLGDHSLTVLKNMQTLSDDPDVRLAALLHDIGKPDTYWEDPFGTGHFYTNPSDPNSQDHEVRGSDITQEFMNRLQYPQDRIDRVTNLIRNHGWNFYSTPGGARRFINKAGDPNAASDLLDLREADLQGKGTPIDPESLANLEMSRALYQKAVQNGGYA